MAITLVINPGSSSKKYALYDDERLLLSARFEQSGGGFERCVELDGERQICEPIDAPSYGDALGHVLSCIGSRNLPGPECVGIRIVAPGRFFARHAHIDEQYVELLRGCASRAPAHIPGALTEIESVCGHLPDLPKIAISDSAFHTSMPQYARQFSIGEDDAARLDLERFGYHGLSVASVVRKVAKASGSMPQRTIVCHVGSGVSVTALKNGMSIDTTMGYAPGGGLIMSGRAGDLDAAALLAIIESDGLTPAAASDYIQRKGGFVGFTGIADLRIILKRYREHDERAGVALDAFLYRLTLAVGGYATALGGLDALVLTATAFERNAELRSLFLQRLSIFNIELDVESNERTVSHDALLTSPGCTPSVWLITTDEMGEIARLTRSIL